MPACTNCQYTKCPKCGHDNHKPQSADKWPTKPKVEQVIVHPKDFERAKELLIDSSTEEGGP